eukprot:3512456-Rhodomonas_salina.2
MLRCERGRERGGGGARRRRGRQRGLRRREREGEREERSSADPPPLSSSSPCTSTLHNLTYRPLPSPHPPLHPTHAFLLLFTPPSPPGTCAPITPATSSEISGTGLAYCPARCHPWSYWPSPICIPTRYAMSGTGLALRTKTCVLPYGIPGTDLRRLGVPGDVCCSGELRGLGRGHTASVSRACRSGRQSPRRSLSDNP